ncbi:Cytoplasmic 60S subunit biogenesis factor [Lachnellula occidentalis]|uniref:Cytoplasmic 60S subunit biogenesis factor n=1 Tax=Lachnellula occidentalis TaxID=215460 RepID=A0A8H8S967_9HELO|nr:Cytoplasmic 60S subunit biogenesis factor [Lachnellula occidentalis]
MDGASTSSTGVTGPELTCTACLASFDSKETKRAHMRDDWHVYNLKRHIASLPPISALIYEQQVQTSNAKNDDTDTAPSFEWSCIACEKHYTNRKAWQAHLKSRNHTEKSAAFNSKAPVVSDELPPLSDLSLNDQEAEEECFNPMECLFCNAESTSLVSNMMHMSQAHSFFIPDIEYLFDLESLLGYLSVVISVFKECLFCGSSKTSKFAVQDHMRAKGHCKVYFDDDEHELKQFYDFSGDGGENGEEQKEELTLVPDEDELRLPSGKILGHRSNTRQFRQHHINRSASASFSQQQSLPEAEPGVEPESETTVPSPRDRSLALRAGTSNSLIGVPELQQRALMAVEHKMLKMETTARNVYQHVLERAGNKQKRFKVRSIGKKQGGLEKRNG